MAWPDTLGDNQLNGNNNTVGLINRVNQVGNNGEDEGERVDDCTNFKEKFSV